MRIVKAPNVRRAEILATANRLFQTKGYTKTSVDEIVRQLDIAKGTFYHYFKSKEDILDALTKQLVADLVQHSQVIADDNNLNAIEKIAAIIQQQNSLLHEKNNIIHGMHLPENTALHERINIETVRVFSPVLAKVIEQGNREGLFQVDDPLSTIQFILAGSQFLLGHGIFHWSPEEEQEKTRAMIVLIERAFAAKTGTFITILTKNT